MTHLSKSTLTRSERINSLVMLLAGTERCKTPESIIEEMSTRQIVDVRAWHELIVDGVAALQEEIEEMEQDRLVITRILRAREGGK